MHRTTIMKTFFATLCLCAWTQFAHAQEAPAGGDAAAPAAGDSSAPKSDAGAKPAHHHHHAAKKGKGSNEAQHGTVEDLNAKSLDAAKANQNYNPPSGGGSDNGAQGNSGSMGNAPSGSGNSGSMGNAPAGSGNSGSAPSGSGNTGTSGSAPSNPPK